MDMDFDISSMRKAHSNVRGETEVGDFLEYAGAEGLLLGGCYPDLAEKMYGKGYGAQEDIIDEMTRGISVLPEETAIMSIREREQLILSKVSIYVSQYHPELSNALRLMDNNKEHSKKEKAAYEGTRISNRSVSGY